MPIFDGEVVDAVVTNAVFLDKTQNDTAIGIYELANTAPASGATITNIQGLMNHLANTTGATVTSDGTTYSSQQRITDGDNHETALGEIDSAFNGSTGHMHTGSAGDGPPISGSGVGGVPLRGQWQQGTDVTVSGANFVDVTTQFISFPVSTGPTVEGVVTTSPFNKVFIRQNTSATEDSGYYDSLGNRVYGRITFSSPNWTLSFFTEISGTETPYTFSGTNGIRFYFQQLFKPLVDAPVYDQLSQIMDNLIHVASFAVTSGTKRYGDISLTAGSGITITDNGDGSFTITNSSSGLTNPMTTLGDMIYGGSGGAATRLAGSTSSSKKFLTQTGTGSASAAPIWSSPVKPVVQTFLSNGTYTPTAGMAWVKITVVGGGGGGGDGANTTAGSGGGGGGGGGTAVGYFDASTIGSSQPVTVGAGGSSGGGTGGTSSVGSGPLILAAGGGGGGNGSGVGNPGTGGFPGNGALGDWDLYGSYGECGFGGVVGNFFGGGGSGGSSFGGGGNGGLGDNMGNHNGNQGSQYGGGGGGGSGGSSASGGAGYQGIVIFEEFFE